MQQLHKRVKKSAAIAKQELKKDTGSDIAKTSHLTKPMRFNRVIGD